MARTSIVNKFTETGPLKSAHVGKESLRATRKAVRELCVAKAIAKIGDSVETEPSISPAVFYG